MIRWALLSWGLVLSPAAADPAAIASLNALRAQEGRAPLIYSERLEEAARLHARDMAEADYFSHIGSDGSNVGQRVTATGYNWCMVAENIAKGQGDLDEVMKAWASSPSHRENMLRRGIEAFALFHGEAGIWVMVLAARNC